MSKKKKEELLPLGHPIFETHCHLDYLKRFALDDLLEKCQQVGVEKIMTIGVSPEHQNIIVDIANHYPHIYCSQGIHPHDASKYSAEIEQIILNNIQNSKVLAIGEIGLDYHYDYSPREIQQQVFQRQLEIALEHKMPIIIHTREADEDTLKILKSIEGHTSRIVLHSYTSGAELVDYAISQNYFIGFNGIITFKNAHNVREILHRVPIEHLVVETDAPFLAPTPHRGIENGPQLLPFIIQVIAQEKNISVYELMPILWKNSHLLFNLEL